MSKSWEPYPPPLDHWPEHVKRIYLAGSERINLLRVQMGPDRICPIPFRCWLCDEMRSDFAMLNGDGVPLCIKCLGFDPAEIEGKAV